MANIRLPHFGMMDTEALEEYYDVEIQYNSTAVQIYLNFESTSIDIQKLETAKHFIDNIRIHDLSNRKHIEKDFAHKDGDTVLEYINMHVESLGEPELASVIGTNTKKADLPRLLLQKLHLIRVGLYPHNEDQYATFDYSIAPEIIDHLVVVFTDINGNLDYMTIES